MKVAEKVNFYYSMGSRYSYLASTQIATLERETSCCVEWNPSKDSGQDLTKGKKR
jgi:2-hydroxychromene-2-carboxylate isomerase